MCEKEAWFFGYGSLIFDPEYNNRKLKDWCEQPIDGQIERGIEFLHTSKSRGGAPTLCFDGSNRITKGRCWRAIGDKNIKNAKNYLKAREVKISIIEITLFNGRKVKAYCGDTCPDLKGKSAKEIAKQALESENKASKGRGGVEYIKKCKCFRITTPMMNEILQEIDNAKEGK
jgi:cation transport regulator ChaC